MEEESKINQLLRVTSLGAKDHVVKHSHHSKELEFRLGHFRSRIMDLFCWFFYFLIYEIFLIQSLKLFQTQSIISEIP